MRLAQVILRTQSPETLARFYVDHLGMTARQTGQVFSLGYSGDACASIQLRKANSSQAYEHQRTDYYWKIGITMPNIDYAYSKLRAASINVSHPHQFEDVGYVCHLQDPEGFSIELLQHTFEGHRGEDEGNADDPFSEARVGQITLRVGDSHTALQFFREQLSMSLLCMEPVLAYGFTLYFLAFTDERPPHEDLEAVGNREWVYQRPYTTLELQCVPGKAGFHVPGQGEPGYVGICISGAARLSADARELLDSGGGLIELQP